MIDRVDGPVYGTRVHARARSSRSSRSTASTPPDRLVAGRAARRASTVGPFRIEFLRVTHSMPDCVAVAIHTPAGTIVHTGDFKIDQTPLDGEPFDLHRFAELGAAGVLALFSDSTNADRRGFTGSERDVIEGFEEIFSSATGKIVVTAFSTSVYRLQLLVDLAEQFDRKVAFVGRGMQQNSQIAERLGYLTDPARPPDSRHATSATTPARTSLCLCTGSQGEPLAALPRIAIDDHRHVQLDAGRRRGLLRPGHSGQREGHRPGDEPRRPAGGGGRRRRPESTSTSPGTAAKKS